MSKNEYAGLLEHAPRIKASGLEGDYRALVEFNDVVLAGHQSKFGMEFVTWEWVQNHTALWQGHYYSDDYDAAKQDFTIRSGLLSPGQLLTNQQFAEVYRCIHETLESSYSITLEREKLLTSIAEQIETVVPNLKELVQQLDEHELRPQRTDGLSMI